MVDVLSKQQGQVHLVGLTKRQSQWILGALTKTAASGAGSSFSGGFSSLGLCTDFTRHGRGSARVCYENRNHRLICMVRKTTKKKTRKLKEICVIQPNFDWNCHSRVCVGKDIWWYRTNSYSFACINAFTFWVHECLLRRTLQVNDGQCRRCPCPSP